MSKLKIIYIRGKPYRHVFFCPGCKTEHFFVAKSADDNTGWNFNGDFDNPTVTPSILTYPHQVPVGKFRCHCFITNGKVQFLGDCSHELKGQIVELRSDSENWAQWIDDQNAEDANKKLDKEAA